MFNLYLWFQNKIRSPMYRKEISEMLRIIACDYSDTDNRSSFIKNMLQSCPQEGRVQYYNILLRLYSANFRFDDALNVLKDAVYYEPIDQSTKMNVNILATSADRQNDPVLQKVGALYHTEAVKQFVQEKFAGTKVDVNKPISYLTESK